MERVVLCSTGSTKPFFSILCKGPQKGQCHSRLRPQVNTFPWHRDTSRNTPRCLFKLKHKRMRKIISKTIAIGILIIVVVIGIGAIVTKDAFSILIVGLLIFYAVFVACTAIIVLLSLGEMGRDIKKE